MKAWLSHVLLLSAAANRFRAAALIASMAPKHNAHGGQS